MASIPTTSNPEMLVWAREGVGYELVQAADALGVTVERLVAAESGEKPFSLNQLRKAADKYSCPFGYFYFSKPPYKHTDKPIPDYRIEPNMMGVDNYKLQLEIKKVRDRRLTYIDLLEESGEERKSFKTLGTDERRGNIGRKIRSRLGVTKAELLDLNFEKAYVYWKGKIENDGVLVYESQYIPVESGVIGMAIFYNSHPIILVKRGGDSNERRLFTLLHEYAHLLIGKSAINDLQSQTINRSDSESTELEADCNYMAGEILVPGELLKDADYEGLTPLEKMEKVSNTFKVTYTTAAVCLRRRNFISKEDYQNLIARRLAEFKNKKNRNNNRETKIPRENIQRLDYGRPFFDVVLGAYESGRIDVYDASNILNLRVKKIDLLVARNAI